MEQKLYKKHPTLFKTIMLVALSNLTIALLCFIQPSHASISFSRIASVGFVHEPLFWGISFLIAGIFCLHGALTTKYQMAKIGLVLSAMVGGFLAIGYWISYFSTHNIGISAAVAWTFYMFACIINSAEPEVNPLSATLQQDINETIAQDKHTNGAL